MMHLLLYLCTSACLISLTAGNYFCIDFKYDIKATVYASAATQCSRRESKEIGRVIDQTITRVFNTERLIHKYQKHNRINKTPFRVLTRRRLMEENNLESMLENEWQHVTILNDNTGSTVGNWTTTNGTFLYKNKFLSETAIGQVEHRDLGKRWWGRGFEFRGVGRCRGCSNDNRDARRGLTGHTFGWLKNLMEPKLSDECRNALIRQFRDRRDHCLYDNPIKEVMVRLYRKYYR